MIPFTVCEEKKKLLPILVFFLMSMILKAKSRCIRANSSRTETSIIFVVVKLEEIFLL